MQQPQYDAVIVGGGHNGLVASFYLARAGMKTLVLERRDFVGGAAITEELFPGYSVPSCSYICYLLQPRIIDDMDLREYGFEILPAAKDTFMPFPNGRSLLDGREGRSIEEQIAEFAPGDAVNLPKYREIRRRMAGIIHQSFFEKAPTLTELVDSVRGTEDEPLLERLLFGSVADLLDEHFEDEQIKGWLAQAWDAGDIDAPGSLLSAAFLGVSAFTRDGDYGLVHGGMGTITQSMARSCQAQGVEIRTNARVEQLLVEDGRAAGVRLESGEEIRSRLVLVNADIKQLFNKLVPKGAVSDDFVRAVNRLKSNTLYYKFHAALNELPDFSRWLGSDPDPYYLGYVKICPSMDYYRKAWNDARNGLITDSPVMHIQMASVIDRSLVPGGGHVMSIWALYAPHKPTGHGSEVWTPELTRLAGETFIDRMEEYAPNIRSAIRDWVMFTPNILEERVGLPNGHIHHIDQIAGQMFANRPLPGWADYQMPLDGLYLCGADTHPGGEVTGANGYNAAHKVLEDARVLVG
ncbi:MAG TPA: NAD(P)/FAD-dependent oxidoreductase [Thermomicrobiales bacterium]|nr:NAD(P)/FAD-dependent oxidoreductase [Thermomicrobiales bacterium]